MKSAIDKALKDLDGLGERAVRTRILGIEDDEPKEENESPGDNETETGLPEEDMDEETKKKLLELLADKE